MNKVNKYSIRKSSFGAVSVAVAALPSLIKHAKPDKVQLSETSSLAIFNDSFANGVATAAACTP